jgi:hypothetical protein
MEIWYADDVNSKSDQWYVQDRRSAWWHLDLLDFAPALEDDRSDEVLEEPLDDESDWPSDDVSAA